ncbi:MAG: hypothetical protein ACE5ES_04975 [Candidatus Nanoarchaeia archaeon]
MGKRGLFLLVVIIILVIVIAGSFLLITSESKKEGIGIAGFEIAGVIFYFWKKNQETPAPVQLISHSSHMCQED